jgi:hypothetical protein
MELDYVESPLEELLVLTVSWPSTSGLSWCHQVRLEFRSEGVTESAIQRESSVV